MQPQEFKRSIEFLKELKKILPKFEEKKDYTFGAVEDFFYELGELGEKFGSLHNNLITFNFSYYSEGAEPKEEYNFIRLATNLGLFSNKDYIELRTFYDQDSKEGEVVTTSMYTTLLNAIEETRSEAFKQYKKPQVYFTDRMPLLIGKHDIQYVEELEKPSSILYEINSNFEKQSTADAVNLLLDSSNFNKNPRFSSTEVCKLEPNEAVYVFIPNDKFEKIELDNIQEIGYSWYKVVYLQ